MAITDFQNQPIGHTNSAIAWERAGRQAARLWREARQSWRDLRATYGARRSVMVVAAIAAGLAVTGAALSFLPPASEITATEEAPQPAVKCEQQVWPYLNDTCLRRTNASHEQRRVRVISLDRDAPRTVSLPEAASKAPAKGAPDGRSKDRPR